ncbi:hypothetical protein [Weissella paramesenteroides]|nr:hypothetical protein [Weissella paramesenteroides]QPI46506.1 hypothetical protein I2E55_00950 [Weissella paramesenteroides]
MLGKKLKYGLIGLLLGILISGITFFAISHKVANGSNTPATHTVKTDKDSLTVKSLSKEKQIVLVNLGLSEILNEEKSSQLFGKNIVGTSRKKFIQASFDAKLGIDGKDVDIAKDGKNSYLITVPKFIFIGYNNPNFKLLDEHNGVFSSFTSDINESDMINKVLNGKSKKKYLTKYNDLLRQSTKEFYRGIVQNTNPDAKLSFKFE